MKTIPVENTAPERLDHYVSRVFPALSRSQFQKRIKAGRVLVDGAVVPVKFPVESGMEITFLDEPETDTTVLAPPPLPEILYEDADVLVLNKPAGLKVHAVSEHDREPTLVQALLAERAEIAGVGDKPEVRPGLVHRLDKHASGVLIVAKNQRAFEHLKTQFKEHLAKKIYTVLVYGKVSKDHEMVELRLERGGKGAMVAHPKESDHGREAKTEYDVAERFATTTLLRVTLHTGRTHQIRAHFFAMSHPVVGDRLYVRKHMVHLRPIPLDRLFLHATELTIQLPSGEERTFTAPLPEELEDVLKGNR